MAEGWLSCSVDASEEPTSGPRLGRLANHGRKDERNARMKVFENSVPTLCLFATKDIPAGTEILYDYGVKVPWEFEVFVLLLLIEYNNLFGTPIWYIS